MNSQIKHHEQVEVYEFDGMNHEERLEHVKRLLALYQEQLLNQDRFLQHERKLAQSYKQEIERHKEEAKKQKDQKGSLEHQLKLSEERLLDLTDYTVTLEKRLLETLNSTSWRVTASIRGLARVMRGENGTPRFLPRYYRDNSDQ